MISNVSPIASVSTLKVDAILAILNFMLRPSLTSIGANPTNGLFYISEPSVAKHLLASFFVENFLIS
jgi:hypothetical protein